MAHTAPQNHRPRKRFGQHFLQDIDVIERIVEAVAPDRDQQLIEIGPGQGALTGPLLREAGRLQAIELDRDLCARLAARYPPESGLTIHSADACKFDFGSEHATDLRIVGNLPYNISTVLIFHLLRFSHCISDMHFMLQDEVVERMAAAPGSGEYGRLSVMLQVHCQPEKLFTVGPQAFNPPPRVTSAVVRLRILERPAVQIDDPGIFSMMVNRVFSQRRKTIRNGLKGLLHDTEIRDLGIDPGCRAETLELAAFALLANAIDPLRWRGQSGSKMRS